MNLASINPKQSQLIISLLISLAVSISACSKKIYSTEAKHVLYTIDKNLPTDTSITNYYKPFKLQLDSVMNRPIAFSDVELKRGKPVGNLNNLVISAMEYQARKQNLKYDIIHTNYKGLRIPLPKGEILLSKVYELMPFENYLTVVELSGKQVRDFFNYLATEGGDPIGGVTLLIKNNVPHDIMIGGQAFDEQKTYRILTIDYMANGGDNASFYLNPISRKDTTFRLRDAIIEYLKTETAKGNVISPLLDERIRIK